ncbi:nitroreductase family protein [Nocardioides carbamazepini]|uniref:nitroreductase family protein n=1 Tax=Nocardioides carbamazepini TaxID=2854259 RepID=UPI00214A2353|nr:nitroreductase family protein [Nocardioides carbamazepini]MCR1786320.1 nitroreductase family protein [Nocardioides carbamazepini]
MHFAAMIASRWSCREHLPEPLPEEALTALLTTGQRTASRCNTQPGQVHPLGGEALDWFAKELHAHAASGTPGTVDRADVVTLVERP